MLLAVDAMAIEDLGRWESLEDGSEIGYIYISDLRE